MPTRTSRRPRIVAPAPVVSPPLRRGNLSPVVAQPLDPITFPAPPSSVGPSTSPIPLRSKVLIALGSNPSADPATWLWEDITGYVRHAEWISVERGRPDWLSRVNPGEARLRLDNRDGRFTRRNPLSPYYGKLSRNTPIRISVNPGDGDHIRFDGYVNEWPVRWDQSANDSSVPIVCAGPLRRLGRRPTVKSPLRRAIAGSSPVAYWPLEDPAGSIRAASAVAGKPAMVVAGTVNFAASTSIVGSKPVPTFGSGGSVTGTVLGGSDTAWSVEFSATLVDGLLLVPVWWLSVDPFAEWHFAHIATNDARLIVYDTLGTQTEVIFFDPGPYSSPHNWVVRASQVASNIFVEVFKDGVQLGTGTLIASTLQRVRQVSVNHFRNSPAMAVGHVAVYNNATQTGHFAAFTGNVGDQAHVRMRRVCAEDGVPFFCLASRSATLGPQPLGTLVEVLRDAEAADLGVLYEQGFGLGYQALSERYAAPGELPLTWDQLAEPPEPTDDDQRYVNRWTVSRPGGSEATVEDMAAINKEGLYDDSASLNVATDDQCEDTAAWLLHRDSVDEDRWPQLDLNFARTPGLIFAWTAAGYGPRLTVTGTLAQAPPDGIDAFVEGHAERWNQYEWQASLATTPASPYYVFTVAAESGDDAEFVGHLDWDTCVLAADLNTTATAVSVTTTPLITTAVDDFPFDIVVRGERMTVTACSGASNPQTLTVVRSVNGVVKTHSTGAAVQLHPAFACYLGL